MLGMKKGHIPQYFYHFVSSLHLNQNVEVWGCEIYGIVWENLILS